MKISGHIIACDAQVLKCWECMVAGWVNWNEDFDIIV
jgi:hypothetical protein